MSSTTPTKKKIVKKVVKKVVKKTTPEPVQEPTPAPVAEVTPEPAVDSPTDSPADEAPKEVDLDARYETVISQLKNAQQIVKSALAETRQLQKDTRRAIKDARKNRRKPKDDPNKPKRAPSGFAKPSLISEELCKFLGQDEGTMMARTEVTKYVTKYIKDNNLQNPDNKRHILPDSTLKKLLNVNDEEVTYFNLQKYMKHHFPKA
jgi:upstream activation factor subunit UAF30